MKMTPAQVEASLHKYASRTPHGINPQVAETALQDSHAAFFRTENGYSLVARVVLKGEAYGHYVRPTGAYSKTHKREEPLLVFYDPRFDEGPHGRHMHAYELSTLTGRNYSPTVGGTPMRCSDGRGLALPGGFEEGRIDGQTYNEIVDWAERLTANTTSKVEVDEDVLRENAMCLWEAFLDLRAGGQKDQPLLKMLDQVGTASLRYALAGNKEVLVASEHGWEIASEHGFEDPFDWEFCPWFLVNCIEVDGFDLKMKADWQELCREYATTHVAEQEERAARAGAV